MKIFSMVNQDFQKVRYFLFPHILQQTILIINLNKHNQV